ncbi:flagellin [Methylobacterium sp. SI9]|uniref:flagellin N-terminal helical domain-containing protein n=1 Tax=Methylobacterium guangdongense TaxID=3138811 RepID=UPI00313E11B1
MSTINLSANVRQGLLSLQDTSSLQATTTQHLSTGKKVSSALDNPVNFFTAAGLDSRSSQLSSLLDGMSNGIQVIQAANKGLTSITSVLQQLQSTVKSARQDSSSAIAGAALTIPAATTPVTSGQLTFKLGNGTGVGVNVAAASAKATTGANDLTTTALATGKGGTFQIQSGSLSGGSVSVTVADGDKTADIVKKINTALATDANGAQVQASVGTGGKVVLTDFNGNNITYQDASNNTAGTSTAIFGAATANVTTPTALTTDLLVKSINSNAQLSGQVKASKDSNGNLQVQNLTGQAMEIDGIGTDGKISGAIADNTIKASAGTNYLSATRQNAANQFNTLLDQVNSMAKDAGYNGTNLLGGDKLKLTFNEKTGTNASTMSVQTANPDGTAFGALNYTSLGLSQAATTADGSANDFSNNNSLDAISDTLTKALSSIQTQSSQLGSALALTQTRQDFTKQIIDVLTTGSGNLTNADMNEEAANSQALSTRQSLGISALSLANTANQGILQLLR